MRPTRARYITACQQLLTFGVVLAALAPAASVVSLDVVVQPQAPPPGLAVEADPEPGLRHRSAVVPTPTVDAELREVRQSILRHRNAGYLGRLQGSAAGLSKPRLLGGGKSYDIAD